jgi:hypothetical protein
MVGQGEQHVKKTTEGITREVKEEIALAARLEQVAAGKRHNGRQDDPRSSEGGAGDGKLLACLSIIVRQDVAPRTPLMFSPFLVPPMLAIHQQLLGHLHAPMGGVGSS